MKSKIRNLLADYSKPGSRSRERISYPRTKTRLSEEDQFDESVWSSSLLKIQKCPSTSYKSSNTSLVGLIKQNQQLKLQISKLQSRLYFHENGKRSSKILLNFDPIPEQNFQENQRLKLIIQKSYYSIKEMQKKILQLSDELVFERKSHDNTEKKVKIMIFEKQQSNRKLSAIVSVHKQQMRLCNQRIQQLQSHIGHLIRLMQQDQKQWKKHMEDLKNFKKFSFKRTQQ